MKKRLFPNSLVLGLATVIGTFALSSNAAAFDPKEDCVFFDKIVFDICKKDEYGRTKCDGPYDFKVEDEFGKVSPNLRKEAYDAACDYDKNCDVKIKSVEFAADCDDEKIGNYGRD